ncbi:MAG: Cof-type HAD-IIB family hydrolase [Desulfitobacterium hafniense]|nr:Cof-type HAD-IIB family hydrolase [Desulfitobacterium hafniense]
MIRLVCFDMDGTLLDTDKKIPRQVLRALHRIQEHGTLVTLASGRLISSLREYAELIGTKAPLIALNGAWVEQSKGDKPMLCWPLVIDSVCEIIESAEKNGLHISLYLSNGVIIRRSEATWEQFHWELEKIRAQMVNEWPSPLGAGNQIGEQRLMKVLVSGEPGLVAAFQAEQESKFGEQYNFVLSGDPYLEIVNKNATKGAALKAVAEHLRIPRECIMAMGDHYNDLSMLEFAGFGVAMGNAPKIVQKKANWVTKRNTEMGVATALAHFFGEWVVNE